jgi:hypothetical protein
MMPGVRDGLLDPHNRSVLKTGGGERPALGAAHAGGAA